MAARLAGRAAIVMGAGATRADAAPKGLWGNGEAVAVQLAREGAKVACVDLMLDAAEATAAKVRADGGSALSLAADATSSADIAAVMLAVVERWGAIDVLHNNVGVAIMGGPVELSQDGWQRSFALNVESAFLAAKHAIPVMQRQGRGVIINTSSIASVRWLGYPFCAYAASKAALNQLTVAIALQHARDGIRCNAILPGLMHTPMIYQQIAGQYDDPGSMVAERDAICPTGRMGTAWDVANAAVFLASDEAAYITGVCLPVDGGLTCRV